jgi:UDP-glucose 4-epimerase
MKAFVTGAAGFLGSHLVDRLVAENHEVTGFDRQWGHDCLLPAELVQHMEGSDIVFHCAALASLRNTEPLDHFEENVQATFNVLEAMRKLDIKRIAFCSSAAVYGDTAIHPTPEDAPFPIQTSLYTAAKVSSEAFLQAYASTFGFQVYIFRFVSLLGERYRYGHVVDFYRKLQADPQNIEVLGDGGQKKSYIYVKDAVAGILTGVEKGTEAVNIFNVGTNRAITVDNSLDIICDELAVTPKRHYSGGRTGWIGDSPYILVDCAALRFHGWMPNVSIPDAIRKTVRYLKVHDHHPVSA